MNKRQRKKREKIIRERLKFFGNFLPKIVRRNGKTAFIASLYFSIYKAIYKKPYGPFKRWVKFINGLKTVRIKLVYSGFKTLPAIFDELSEYPTQSSDGYCFPS